MPSSLTKLVFIYVMIGATFNILLPDAGLTDTLVQKFMATDQQSLTTGTNYSEILPTTGNQSGIVDVYGQYVAPLQMVWNFITFAVDSITVPIGIANYMIAQGAPKEAVTLAVLPFVVLLTGAVIDFVRRGD